MPITDGSDNETKALHIALRYAIHYCGELRDKGNAALLKAANEVLVKLEAGIAPQTEREMLMAARNSFVATVNEMHAAAHGVPIGPNGEIEGAVEPVLGLVEDVEALYARATNAEKARDNNREGFKKADEAYVRAVRERDEARAQAAAMRASWDRWNNGVHETRAALNEAMRATNAGRDILDALEQARGALTPFRELGRPGPSLPAFHDLGDDVVVYDNSGVYITAGDVRRAQAALVMLNGIVT